MTERMENALRHISSSLDVDPWAVEEVERIFMAVDDIKAELKEMADSYNWHYDAPRRDTLQYAILVIDKHIGERSRHDQRRSNKN